MVAILVAFHLYRQRQIQTVLLSSSSVESNLDGMTDLKAVNGLGNRKESVVGTVSDGKMKLARQQSETGETKV